MANTHHTHDMNPFVDPEGSEISTQTLMNETAVLNVDRNATLTLGTDALIVLDEGLKHERAAGNLCGLLPQFSKTTRAIPFHGILWAELNGFEIIIKYALPSGKKGCRVAYINYTVTDKTLHAYTRTWVEALMDRAYPPNTQRKKRMKVLINPFGGQGYAQRLWTREVEPIFAAARCDVDVEKTAYKGHAADIAEKLDVDAFDVVACASGDGLPYEVFNGLARQKQPRRALRKLAVAHIPCGSGNAMSQNLYGTVSASLAAVAIVKGVRSPLDLMAITQGTNTSYSFLSQAVGIVAESDLGTESLRWMGSFRFTWGILVRLLGKTVYPAELSVVVDSDDKREIRERYRRAIEEHQAAAAKHLPPAGQDLDTLDADKIDLPPLKYGRVTDPLAPDFLTQDLPTLGNFFVGNMCWMAADTAFFPTALPADGRMDMINIDGLIPRTTALRMLTTIEEGTLTGFPEVSYRKVLAYRITPRVRLPTPDSKRFGAKFGRWLGGAGKQKEPLIAIDGERVPFEPFQAEVVPGLGTVLSKRGAVFEFDLPDTA
ncbi:sphinganine kinase lcb4 [Teratosphaeriaceae sp. CCFEE 6253]|nr:sphinganine kinase lcb4 [Teratosphaeriaceae sp. CCFEE 6253]